MKYSTYIYGRTLNIDFREICSPQDGLSSKSISLIEQLINTDVVSNGEINRLRYLFVREQQQVLFGVGFNHRQFLDKDHWTDLTGKRGLRSFVGIVIDNEEFDKLTSIPIDYGFYMDLYLKHISDVWDLDDRPKNRKVIISQPEIIEQSENWCKLDGNVVFNSDDGRCRFFTPTEEESLIHSIKNCHSSVVIGLNVESHVISAFRKFNVVIPNAICLDTQINHDDEWDVTNQEQQLKNEKNRHNNRFLQGIGAARDEKELNKAKESDIKDSTQEPAILSDLKKYEPSGKGNTDQKQIQKKDLMSIDWGEECTIESPKASDDNSNNDQLDEIIEEGKDDLKVGTSGQNPEDVMNTADKLKKAYRLMMIMAIVTVVIVLLTIVLCSRMNKNFSPSSLGGTEMKKKEKMKRGKNVTSDTIIEQVLKEDEK